MPIAHIRRLTGEHFPDEVLLLLADHVDGGDVARLDPLGADGFLTGLPDLNRAGDVDSLAGFLTDVASTDGVMDLDADDARAAMRDVGMVLGSIRRHGQQPCAVVPQIEPVLIEWGRTTQLVPRDTVVHYGAWNPIGDRERMYTGDPQESALIDSVRQAADLIPAMAVWVAAAHARGWGTPESIAALEMASTHFDTYCANFEAVRAHVTPEFFARELRPYFEPITVAGRTLNGPAAAFLPLYLVDELVWGESQGAHAEMIDDAVQYGPPLWGGLVAEMRRHTPMAAMLIADLDRAGHPDALAREGQIASHIIHRLVQFRGRHAVLAERAYNAAITTFQQGSGGYRPDVLRQITQATFDAQRQLDHALQPAHHHEEGTADGGT